MKSICKKVLILLVVTIFLLSFNFSLAVTQSEINAQQNLQKENQNKINNVQEEKKKVEKEKSETQKEVEKLSSQIDSYQDEIDGLNSKIDEANNKINEAQDKIKESEETYNKKMDILQRRIVALYEAGETSNLDVLLNSQSFTDFLSKYYIVSEVADHDMELLQTIQKEKEETEKAKQELENSKKELDTAKSSKESVTTQLKSAKSQKDAKVAQLTGEEAELQKQIDELKSHESSISNKIKQMQAEYDKQNKPSSGGCTNGGTLNGGTSSFGFGWPVANHKIGTSYGVSGQYWSSGYHTGIDFPVPDNTPVYAVGDGQIFDTGYNRAYGNFVEIYHGNNVYSFYAHATSVNVSVGQKVTKGQKIMSSGHSGNVTGAHLHFEIRTPGYQYAHCVNPRPYLP